MTGSSSDYRIFTLHNHELIGTQNKIQIQIPQICELFISIIKVLHKNMIFYKIKKKRVRINSMLYGALIILI